MEDVDAPVCDVDEGEEEERDDDGEDQILSPVLEEFGELVDQPSGDGLRTAKLDCDLKKKIDHEIRCFIYL